MEHHKKLKSSSQFLTPQQLKKMIPQLLLSISIFSFLFSYSSSSVYSPKPLYFSANYFQPLSYALNKNCIFLICNGLLVFLAKTSGFVRAPPSALDLNDILLKPIGDGLQTEIEAKDEKLVADETARDPEDEEEKKEIDRCSSSETPKEVSIFIAESEEEGGGACCDLEDVEKDEICEAESRKCWLFDDDDDEEEEEDKEGETEMLSTEELNQKFEDFIRRMKEEIMVNEARQKQLVLVN